MNAPSTFRALGVLCMMGLAVAAVTTFAGAETGPAVVPLNGSADFGDLADLDINEPIVAMTALPDGSGYWLVASDGGVFAFGGAQFHGSSGALALVSPMVAMATTPGGNGYWLAAGDGGVFSYGNAAFHGSAGGIRLAEPVVGMAATPTGNGYWLVASDGGIFSYGDARFHGSTGALSLQAPIVGMAATPTGNGYWLLGSDGGVFTFGDAQFHGSALDPNRTLDALSIGVSSAGGYWIVTGDSKVHTFGPVDHFPGPDPQCASVAVRGGAVSPAGVWLYTTAIDVPQPPFASTATGIDGASIAEQLAYAQACQTLREPTPAEFVNPLPGSVLTSGFGTRLHPIWDIFTLHAGADVFVASGSFGLTVKSAASGTVVAVDSRSAYGSTVVVDHGGRVATVYAHLSAIDVAVGDSVLSGTKLGEVGATGFVTGAHLHVELRVNGVPRDPVPFLGLG